MPLPVIAITNQSTVLSDAEVQAVIPALQKQVTDDFRPYYQQDCTLTFLSKDHPLTDGWWQIVIVDDPDQAGALGYHELSSQNTPLGKVFAKLDLQAGYKWTVTISHELLEMLADPWVNWVAMGSDGKLYALEVADPVEADDLGYEIDGVQVSDFITPSWFEPTEFGRYDFKFHLDARLKLAPGGYISVLDPNSGWLQLTDQKAENYVKASLVKDTAPIGSRRQRRTIPKYAWRKSER